MAYSVVCLLTSDPYIKSSHKINIHKLKTASTINQMDSGPIFMGTERYRIKEELYKDFEYRRLKAVSPGFVTTYRYR